MKVMKFKSQIANLVPNFFPGYGRGTTKFQNFENLLKAKDDGTLGSLEKTMSCLVAVVDVNNELEVSKLIDIMHELQINHKYLTVIMDTLNTSLLHEKSINFNVIVNHRGKGNNHYRSL